MKIGDRVRLDEKVDMGYYVYEIGHEFTVVGEDDIRGLDLKDDEGRMLCETRFVKMSKIPLRDQRDKKINKILK
jgi:hypothetical protein